MLKFVMKNVNPKGKKTCDCVIRAITEASNEDYYKVYQDLYEISLKTGYMVNEKRCEEKLLEKYGFIKQKQPRKDDGTKYLVRELDKLVEKDDVVVVSIAHHLTCVKNHTIYDLWDCGYKTVGNYYIKRSK